ncbi:MAG: hypothetical protein ACOVP6_10870 [Lacibacter sp.]
MKKEAKKPKQVIFFYCISVFVLRLIYAYFFNSNTIVAQIIYSFYIPIEFGIIIYFYHETLNYYFHKKAVILSGILFLAYYTKSVFSTQLGEFNSIINGISLLLTIAYSLLYFYEQLRFPSTLFIYAQPDFWFITGFFMYAAGAFFVFLFRESSVTDNVFFNQYLYIHSFASILRSILFSIAMITKPEKARAPEFF